MKGLAQVAAAQASALLQIIRRRLSFHMLERALEPRPTVDEIGAAPNSIPSSVLMREMYASRVEGATGFPVFFELAARYRE